VEVAGKVAEEVRGSFYSCEVVEKIEEEIWKLERKFLSV